MTDRETSEFLARLFGGADDPEQDEHRARAAPDQDAEHTEPDKTPEQLQAETEPDLIAALTRPKPWARSLVDQSHSPKEEP